MFLLSLVKIIILFIIRGDYYKRCRTQLTEMMSYLPHIGVIDGRCYSVNLEVNKQYIILGYTVGEDIRPYDDGIEATAENIHQVSLVCGMSPRLPIGGFSLSLSYILYIYIYIYIYVCVCVCVCVFHLISIIYRSISYQITAISGLYECPIHTASKTCSQFLIKVTYYSLVCC